MPDCTIRPAYPELPRDHGFETTIVIRHFLEMRRRLKKSLFVAILAVLVLIPVISLEALKVSTAAERHKIAKADVEEMLKSLSNWGRWGKEDQRGALNLITSEERTQAAALVKSGVSVSLSHNAITERIGNSAPFEHHMVQTGVMAETDSATDIYSVQYHGFTQTHLDALCHLFYGGQMYNGFSRQDVTDKGAATLSVINIKTGIFTRGILMDFPRLFGTKYLKGDQAIYPEDLDAWEKKTGLKVQSGDAVFIRTGRWARRQAEGEWDMRTGSAGLHVSCMPWFKKRDISVLASDLVSDVMPSGVDGFRMPVHLVTIYAMGVPILDNCDLEAISEYSDAHRRCDFLLTLAPLAVEGGTGSPVNPIATF